MTVQLRLPHVGAEREPAPSGRRLPSFVGPKTPEPIATRERWQRDALVTLSLDPQVATIHPVEDADTVGVLFTVGVTDRNGGTLILRFVANEQSRRWSQPTPGVAVISRDTVMRSPGLEARRAVWAARDASVSANDRYRVADALDAAPDGLPLKAVIRLVQGRARDVVDCVCALACEDIISIDLAGGLTPEAVVRRAHKSASTGESCAERSEPLDMKNLSSRT